MFGFSRWTLNLSCQMLFFRSRFSDATKGNNSEGL
jgi:hypothetical protein